MKYFLVSAVILLLGCSMPGVGELEERVDDLEITAVYDDSDLVELIDELYVETGIIDERLTALESGDVAEIRDTSTPQRLPRDEIETLTPELPDLTIEDIEELQNSMDVMRIDLLDSISVRDGSIESMVLTLDSLTIENDSLRIGLAELQDQIESLTSTVENMRSSSTSSTSTSGGGARRD